jgi:predicted deacylase
VSEELGKIGSYPLLLLTPKQMVDGPNLMIAAGFHGEEPAGCWGILQYLGTLADDNLPRANISFLPLVNPTGFREGRRVNDWGENPNRGFCHTDSGVPEPTREGQILLDNLSRFRILAKDGFVSLHEDSDQKRFYIYTFEKGPRAGDFSEALRRAEAKLFEPCPDGEVEGSIVQNGIVYCECDGSFEDLLFHEGVPRTACTETPALLDINQRIAGNVNIIRAFVDFAVS